jgi:hypothetical protein
MQRHIPFNYGECLRDINLQTQIFARYETNGTGATYSFSSSAAQLGIDIITQLIASSEFTDLQDQFAIYKIEGVRATLSSSMSPGVTAFQALPPAFFAMNYGHSGSVSVTNIAKSDTALEFKLNALGSQKQSLSVGLPPMLFGANGYPILGTSVWFSTFAPVAAGTLALLMGWLQVPTFASTASNQNIPVAVVDIHVKIRFAQPSLE